MTSRMPFAYFGGFMARMYDMQCMEKGGHLCLGVRRVGVLSQRRRRRVLHRMRGAKR
jgi:hypothetical protein